MQEMLDYLYYSGITWHEEIARMFIFFMMILVIHSLLKNIGKML